MQDFKIYVSAASSVGEVRDYVNARAENLPSIVKGVETRLRLRLFATPDGDVPYPIEQLEEIAAWKWVMDKDYDPESNYIMVADHENITVQSVTETSEDITYTYTEVSIPLPNTNTVELEEWLSGSESKSGLTAELVGYDANGGSVFVLQIENFTVRNRLTSAGDPTDIPSEYWTEAQVRSFVIGTMRNPLEYEFSVDGTSWHATQTDDDRYYRMRISGIGADWSSAVKMSAGTTGKDGEDGVDGKTPERGVDYWTEEDKAEIKSYIDAAILNGEW